MNAAQIKGATEDYSASKGNKSVRCPTHKPRVAGANRQAVVHLATRRSTARSNLDDEVTVPDRARAGSVNWPPTEEQLHAAVRAASLGREGARVTEQV